MSKRAAWIQAVIFTAMIALFFLLNLILPDRQFSERENRYLTQSPKFDLSSLASGEFTSNFEKYTTDQFVFRDNWTELKAGTELLTGKHENNNVYYCGNDTLIERFDGSNTSQLETNLDAVNALAENTGIPVYFALIPGAAEIWSYKLPSYAPVDSQRSIIESAYEDTAATVSIDICGALEAHKEEYIFYRTDHHWTSLGAYYGYMAIADAMGFTPSPLSSYDRKTMTKEFYGTVYSTSGFAWVKPDSIETFVQPDLNLAITNYPSGTPVAGMLYDKSFLDKKDKYSMFLGGNTPLIQIETGNRDAPSLLIIRDSYTDSLTPFLLENFSKIEILDLRYYKQSLADYIEGNPPDEILVCYSVSNFMTDTNIFLAGR